ncbi:AB hydrolase-1 domain-containing protein [Aphelenchoides bicaudatus]|nr:AB hydrolase-1 domain-containing protein [Aphelenchoides bicaudatus]
MGVHTLQSDLEADIPLKPIVHTEEPKLKDDFLLVNSHQIFTLQAEPSRTDHSLTVVLIHDQINDSYSWSETKTLQTLALHGYHAVAFDLPSHGRSTGQPLQNSQERADFLLKFLDIAGLSQQRVVLVGASMAGQFLIPFLNLMTEQNLAGVIGVGLSDAQELDATVVLPKTLLIRGEMDTSIGLNAANAWKHQENVRQFVVPSGKHLCHLGNSQLFNKVLINFLNSLSN